MNEIDALLSNEENIDLVKEKLTDFTAAFEAFKEARNFYLSYVQDETCIARCQESFDREVVRRGDFSRRVQEWIVRTGEAPISRRAKVPSQARGKAFFFGD